MSPSRPHSEKERIRRRVLDERKRLDAETLVRASEQIRRRLREFSVYLTARTVHCYVSLADEVQTGGIFADCWRDGKELFVPYQIQNQVNLGLARHCADDVLAPGPFGVLEPAPERRVGGVTPASLDLVLVPGVAFDRRGNRVGYGKGFYDRFLADAGLGASQQPGSAEPPPRLAIGLALDLQIVPELPVCERDIALGAIITEREVIRPDGG